MKNWFKKSKKGVSPYLATSENKFKAIQRVEMKPIDYPAKIILAWAKAIEGNNDLLLWFNCASNGNEDDLSNFLIDDSRNTNSEIF